MYSSFKKHQLITESWRRFINEAEEERSDVDAVSYIDDLLSDTHASGRPISGIFDPIIDENENSSAPASELISAITPEYLASFLLEHQKLPEFSAINVGDVLADSSLTEIEKAKKIAVYNSIILFTAGSVSTVREPATFDPVKTHPISTPRGKYTIKSSSKETQDDPRSAFKHPYVLQPTQELYSIANHVIYTLSTMQNVNPWIRYIYRGLMLPEEVYRGLQVGVVFNSRGPSSWTTDKETAIGFAIDAFETPETPCAVVFVITDPSYGNNISNFSMFEREREFLLGKSVRIYQIVEGTGTEPIHTIHCEIS